MAKWNKWTIERAIEANKRHKAGENMADIMRDMKLYTSGYYTWVKRAGLDPVGKNMKREKKYFKPKAPIEIPLRPMDISSGPRVALVVGTPQDISQMIGDLWK